MDESYLVTAYDGAWAFSAGSAVTLILYVDLKV